MPGGKDYVIQFVGLSVGKHEYEFNVSDKFFDGLDYSEIKQGNITVNLSLIKQSAMMSLDFEISGTVKVNCDLCTEEFDLPISGNYTLIIKVGGSDSAEEEDDIVTVAANEHELDLAQYIYEYIILSLPSKRVHPNDKNGNSTCDPEMLEKVKQFLIDKEKTDITDPRWDQLKNIDLN
jgi:uncharacterized protein